jgi:hypothetical protein
VANLVQQKTNGMSKVSSLTGVVLAIVGLALFGFGIYYIKFSTFCGPGEPAIVCLRSWVGVIGPIVAVFALILAISQYSFSRDSAQRQVRAYVGVLDGSFQVVNLTEGGQGIRVHVRLKNSGKSPAYEFTTWIAAPVIAGPSEELFAPRQSGPGSSSILFADGEVNLSATAPITPEQIQSVKAGTSRIFAWGGADYRDAFGVVRTLKFHDINARDETVPGVWALQPHRKGYQAD